MPPAARTGDSTAHGGLIGTPPPGAVAVATVLIGGRPRPSPEACTGASSPRTRRSAPAT
ncbi:hypothetical protein SBADM41S_07458 [Streptomyces badius]